MLYVGDKNSQLKIKRICNMCIFICNIKMYIHMNIYTNECKCIIYIKEKKNELKGSV